MNAVTQLPTWAVYVAGIGSPVAAFLAVPFGNWVARRGQKETETRSKREEVMRNLRWAAELAVDTDPNKAALGVDQLRTLAASHLNDEDVQKIVDSALASVVEDIADEIDEDPDAEVVPAPMRSSEDALDGLPDLHSEKRPDDEGGRQ